MQYGTKIISIFFVLHLWCKMSLDKNTQQNICLAKEDEMISNKLPVLIISHFRVK